MMSQTFFCKAPQGVGSKVALHPGCVYAWKAKKELGPYDERNKSYLELVKDDTNNFPTDCFFRVLASRGVVTIRSDQYTVVALNSFIDRCDPNVDITYATPDHPFPFEPVTLQNVNDPRHPCARGLVQFVPGGAQSKYFYPGSRIQLDHIVIGILTVVQANAIIAAATRTAETAKNEAERLVGQLRDSLTAMKSLYTSSATSTLIQKSATAIDSTSLKFVSEVTKNANTVKQKFTEASEAKAKVDAAVQSGVDISTIEDYRTTATTAVGEASTLYGLIQTEKDTILAALKTTTSVTPTPPTPVLAPLDSDQLAELDGVTEFKEFESIVGDGTPFGPTGTDALAVAKKSAVQKAAHDLVTVFRTYKGSALDSYVSRIKDVFTALSKATTEPEMQAADRSIDDINGEMTVGLNKEMASVKSDLDAIKTVVGAAPVTAVDPATSITEAVLGQTDGTKFDSVTAKNHIENWIRSIIGALLDAARAAFGKKDSLGEITTLMNSFTKYDFCDPIKDNADYEYIKRRVNEKKKLIESATATVWKNTKGACNSPLGDTAVQVPETANRMKDVLSGVSSGNCNYAKLKDSNDFIFATLSAKTKNALNAITVRKNLQTYTHALFAVSDGYIDALNKIIDSRPNVPKNIATRKFIKSFNAWNLNGTVNVDYEPQEIALPEVNFKLPSAVATAV